MMENVSDDLGVCVATNTVDYNTERFCNANKRMLNFSIPELCNAHKLVKNQPMNGE